LKKAEKEKAPVMHLYVSYYDDGWYARHDRGFLLRRNPAHIERVRQAITARRTRDVELCFEPDLKELLS
jgi:hypothetical protein